MKVSRIVLIVLLTVTVVYVVAFAYAEATKPSKISYLYIGDIFVQAIEVDQPTDNETVWTDALGKTWKQPYRGELQNPNIYVKTAIKNVRSYVKVPPKDDFQFETGAYHYNDHYYAIIKDIRTEGSTAGVNAFWKSAVDQNKNFIFAGVLLAFGWAGLGTYSLEAGRRVKVLNAVTLTVAILVVAFLVEDMYRLQKEYEIVGAPLEYLHMSEEHYRMIKGKLEEIQNMINLRMAAVVLVVAATAVTLLVLNKRELFKQKYVATALILLLITFFQTPTVHARISQTGFWRGYAGVRLTIPQDSYLESVTGYITPRPDDVSEGFIGGYIDVYAHTPDWNDWIQAGYTTDIELGTVFYIETYLDDNHDINTAPGVSFFEKYLIHIQMEIVGGEILWSAFIYDVDGNTMLKMENVFLRYSLTYRATAMAESTADCNGFEAEFSELEWKFFLDGEGYWDGTEGLTCTVIEDDPYFVKMKAQYYHFFATAPFGPKSLGISVSSYGHGTTNPVPGYHTYDYGEVVTVKATADYGYGFDYWDLDGGMYRQNPIVITMIEPYAFEAHFKSASGGGGGDGGCPTLFVWNGTAYVEEGTLDIHAESDVTVQHRIKNSLALENGVYNLQLRELDNHTSHIDQAKLYAVDDEGEWHLCPLIYAKHNDSYVTWKLLFDDEKRINLTPTQMVNLKFLRSFPYSKTTYFVFEINGYNRKTHT